jgi:hypothetical protein
MDIATQRGKIGSESPSRSILAQQCFRRPSPAARTNEGSDPSSIGTLREAKVFLEHWAMGASKSQVNEKQEQKFSRERDKGLRYDHGR